MKKILIIEDDHVLAKTLTESLTKEGFEIETASDGKMGLEMAMKSHPHAILLDIVMPKMDGMTVLKNLREDEWGKSVPVILLTNLSDSDKIAEAIARGAYDFLIKSDWSMDEVIAIVKERLASAKKHEKKKNDLW